MLFSYARNLFYNFPSILSENHVINQNISYFSMADEERNDPEVITPSDQEMARAVEVLSYMKGIYILII